ncbi:cytochrome P450 [Labrys sp. KB_33_2]|uniref:cytochrome P450 n=1 Tax=Labrys sp. KB_33_2 TaxID=3237479 RepID=UPI003F8FB472
MNTIVMSSKARKEGRSRAPGPRGNVVMGNLAEYVDDPISMLMKLRNGYGDIARNRLGPFMTHLLSHPEHVEYVLQENHRNYCRGRFYDNFKLFFGDGILTTEGDFWRKHRRIVQPVFNKGAIDDGTAGAAEATAGLIERWNRLPAGKAIDVIPEMMHYSLAALGLMMFNTDISRQSQASGPLVRYAIEAIMPQGNLNDLLPRWLPTPFNLRTKKMSRELGKLIQEVIDQHRRSDNNQAADIITLLLDAKDADTGQSLTAKEVHDEVMTIFLAGHETTGSGLGWALLALAQHPAVLRRLREELDAKLGGRMPTTEDLKDLPYLDQVVNETLRVYPPIWAFTRDLIEDDEIGGYRIPAKSSIFLSPYVTHRHPEFWSNPEAFDPENFASHAPERHKYAYFPFGGGMRKCIGYQVALLMTRVLVAGVAQHFDLALSPGHPLQRGAFVSLRPVNGLDIVVTPRKGTPPRPGSGSGRDDGAGVPSERPVPHGEAAAGCPFRSASPTPVEQLPASATTEPEKPTEVGPAFVDLARIDPPAASGEEDTPRTRRFVWQPMEIAPLPVDPAPDLAGKRILIVNGRTCMAEDIALALSRACCKAYVFAPGEGDDIELAMQACHQDHGPFDGIIDLTLPPPFDITKEATWEAPIARSLAALRCCYEQWCQETDANRAFYLPVTWMDGRMGYGPSGLAQPLGGLWAGLAKTLPQEIPNCNIRILDLSADETDGASRRIVQELYRWGLFEIGYCGGKRFTLQAICDRGAEPARPVLSREDTVLFSGGGRGIGLLCAEALAVRTGATVVVTGRMEPATGDEPWARLNEAEFKAYAQAELAKASRERPVVAIRRKIDLKRQRLELRRTLDRLRLANSAVRYVTCDVTDKAGVTRLCEEIGPRLRMVIHNAGVDRPLRLAHKEASGFIATIRTKIAGFVTLYQVASNQSGLVTFCNVGSLTGRMGGMTGETDYAAANEGLARLGLWAGQIRPDLSIKTLVWPTWEQVGMITNFDVTKRYVSPMPVEEGLGFWLSELAEPRGGEIMFMGSIGQAVTPVQINGFPMIYDVSGLPYLIYRRHHVGAVRRFIPFRHISTVATLDPRFAAFMHERDWAGRSALAPTMAIELALGAGSWVMAQDFKPTVLAAIRDVRLDLRACRLFDGAAVIELLHDAEGRWEGDDWVVDVKANRCDIADPLLTMTVVFRPFEAAAAQNWSSDDSWLGPSVTMRSADGADLWALPYPPSPALPVAQLDHIIRQACKGLDSQASKLWAADEIVLGPADPATETRIVAGGQGRYAVLSGDDQLVASIDGARLLDPLQAGIRPIAAE